MYEEDKIVKHFSDDNIFLKLSSVIANSSSLSIWGEEKLPECLKETNQIDCKKKDKRK